MKKDYTDKEEQKQLKMGVDLIVIVTDSHEELIEKGFVLQDMQVLDLIDYLTIHDFLLNEGGYNKVVFNSEGFAYAKK